MISLFDIPKVIFHGKQIFYSTDKGAMATKSSMSYTRLNCKTLWICSDNEELSLHSYREWKMATFTIHYSESCMQTMRICFLCSLLWYCDFWHSMTLLLWHTVLVCTRCHIKITITCIAWTTFSHSVGGLKSKIKLPG